MGVGTLRCGARSCRRRLQVAQQLQMMEVSPNTLGFLGRRFSTVPVTETQRSHYQRVVHSETSRGGHGGCRVGGGIGDEE